MTDQDTQEIKNLLLWLVRERIARRSAPADWAWGEIKEMNEKTLDRILRTGSEYADDLRDIK